ncbi:DUF6488 family protein [Cellvibrio sp. QJXJ]|uniref:DUF6488 family protein n=1 Tax=Cellvibrio sp. QJXJ TaxID=2964606 RepID=UPI0021C3D47C|nr:DUF6488 family protein [Cellvibrio sp. QJXJ]UUA72083.1 DUF6488 family protein [Cellvibrio sp. QJXJ]
MKKIAPFVLAGLLACTNQVMAHADHEHTYITETAAVEVAQKTVKSLTQKDAGLGFGKLPASWASLPADKVKLKKNGTGYYIVSAANETEGKTLYILLSSEDGEVYDANFTGEFKNLKE